LDLGHSQIPITSIRQSILLENIFSMQTDPQDTMYSYGRHIPVTIDRPFIYMVISQTEDRGETLSAGYFLKLGGAQEPEPEEETACTTWERSQMWWQAPGPIQQQVPRQHEQ